MHDNIIIDKNHPIQNSVVIINFSPFAKGANTRCIYGNPNMTKLSKFKLKGVKAQILRMEGCKRSKLPNSRVQKYRAAYGRVQKVKPANSKAVMAH